MEDKAKHNFGQVAHVWNGISNRHVSFIIAMDLQRKRKMQKKKKVKLVKAVSSSLVLQSNTINSIVLLH